jgi:hypothetical protein
MLVFSTIYESQHDHSSRAVIRTRWAEALRGVPALDNIEGYGLSTGFQNAFIAMLHSRERAWVESRNARDKHTVPNMNFNCLVM